MMDLAKRLVVVVAIGTVCSVAACKSNSISATTNNASDVIGPAGGTLKGADGEELLVPAGALTANTTFTLSVAQPGSGSYPSSPPAGLQFVGDVFEYQPHGTQFLTAATVIVPYTTAPTTAVLLQAEEGATSWTTVNISGTQANAVEGEVSTLSYFVVAEMGANAADGGDTCSGRAPVTGAPTAAAASGMTGMIGSALDLSTVVDGYAAKTTLTEGDQCDSAGMLYRLTIYLTPYSQACGYAENGDSKIGSTVGSIEVRSTSPITTQQYLLSSVQASATSTPASTPSGSTCVPAVSNSSFFCPTGAAALTITTIDEAHVAGNFDFPPTSGGAPITGTFDVPFCAPPTNLDPFGCCIP